MYLRPAPPQTPASKQVCKTVHLTKAELHESIFEAINSRLSKHHLMIGEVEEDLSVIYATVVEAVACPRTTYTLIAEGRKEGERPQKS